MREPVPDNMKPPSEETLIVRRKKLDQANYGGDAGTPDGKARAREIGGRKGAEPTRFGDWEKNGRCIDF